MLVRLLLNILASFDVQGTLYFEHDGKVFKPTTWSKQLSDSVIVISLEEIE